MRAYFTSLRDARRELRAKASRAASIASSNDVFNESARRAIADLYMLMTELPEGPYPYAGIPWYSTVFGRDGLITAMMMLWVDPTVARGVLGHLAATQATEVDPAADAEPGKILHEARHGEMAVLREVPFRRYYGSVDSTPLFVMLAGEYLDRTDDIETCRRLWPNIEAALGWIETYGDRDGDGLVEYGRRTVQGLANQGWKDSYDAIFHADGSLAKGPIALAEVQAYVFAAWRSAERIMRRLGQPDRAAGYGAKAEAHTPALRRAVLRRGARLLRPRARRRQEAMPRPRVQCGTCALRWRRAARTGGVRRAGPDGQFELLRLGHSHHRLGRSALQSDELSQRLGLAA